MNFELYEFGLLMTRVQRICQIMTSYLTAKSIFLDLSNWICEWLLGTCFTKLHVRLHSSYISEEIVHIIL